jgi:hypothetical protein
MSLLKKYGVYPSRPEQVPEVEHWVILSGRSTTIPGDQRSREAPGHGYPEHTDYHLEYEAFLTEDDFKHEVTRRVQQGDKNWRAIHVLPVQVQTVVEITSSGTK